jgi:hypothetical protein
MINVAAASLANSLRVAFVKNNFEEVARSVPTTAGAGWQMVAFDLNSKSENPWLSFIVDGSLDATITSLSVVRDGAVMDFDTADKRFSWRNDNDGSRAIITPDGEGPSGAINWAAMARPTPSRAAGTDWPLRNRQLALVGGTLYKVCLDVRQPATSLSTDVALRVARILSAGSEVVRVTFRPRPEWTQVCSEPFVPPTGDNNLQIGFDGPTASQPFFVDAIAIQRQPCGPVENGCVSPDQCVDNACRCVPTSRIQACGSQKCGTVADGCGGTVSCGECSVGFACYAYTCIPRSCLPKKCGKGLWWHQDSCSCEPGLPQ